MPDARKPIPKSDSTLTVKDIERLITVVSEQGIDELEYEHEGTRLRIVARRAAPAPLLMPMSAAPHAAPLLPPASHHAPLPAEPPPPAPSAAAAPAAAPAAPGEEAKWTKITSPMVGTFYRAASPDAPPFVNVGDRVDDNSVLCILEAMKLMNEIKAEMRGTVRRILVENGQPVEYGQAIFLIEPS